MLFLGPIDAVENPVIPWDRYSTRSLVKWSTAGLNLEFSIFYIGYITKAKELILFCYLPMFRGNHLFPKSISAN